MPPQAIVPRLVVDRIADAARLAPIVLLEGPRACGKSTVLRLLRDRRSIDSIVDLTDPALRRAAADDPRGFVESLTPPVAVDEVQLVPDLALAFKRLVDENPDPGLIVLTGSSPVARGTLGGSDPLVGRATRIKMHPLTRRELAGRPDSLLPALVDPEFRHFARGDVDRDGYVDLAGRSGFPVARDLARDDVAQWFENVYANGVLPRALDDENRRVDPGTLRQVLRTVAAAPAAELNQSALARRLEVNRATVSVHLELLEGLGLIRPLPGWRRGGCQRHTARPKLHPVDGALSTWAIGSDPTDGEVGGVIEAMVVREIAAQTDASLGAVGLYHWRSRSHEVDLLLVHQNRFIPIEVKLSRSIPTNALRGIDAFEAGFPDHFERGIVLYSGDEVVPLGSNRLAVPICALWSTDRPD